MSVNGTTLTISRVDGNTTSASLAVSTLGAAGGGAMGTSVAVDFEGQPTQGEVWTLSLTTTSGTETHSFAVLYGDTLSDIASGLGKALSLDTYNVSVVGRVLTISLLHGGQLSAGIAISPDSLGGAVITQQLVFTSANWNVAQTVTVQALDNQFADGHDALVFPPMTGTLNQVLGPVIIDGGLSVNPEPFLNNPLMLPGETNLPLADGTIGPSGSNLAAGLTAAGLAFISDPNATSVTATTGQRPGFDPRMNDFAYTVEFLNGTAAQETLDVSGTSHDILSVANITPFTFALTGGDYRFIGTPDQSMTEGSLHTSTLTFADATVRWTSATLTLAGSANVGDTWTLVLNGTSYTVTVVAGQTSLADHRLEACSAGRRRRLRRHLQRRGDHAGGIRRLGVRHRPRHRRARRPDRARLRERHRHGHEDDDAVDERRNARHLEPHVHRRQRHPVVAGRRDADRPPERRRHLDADAERHAVLLHRRSGRRRRLARRARARLDDLERLHGAAAGRHPRRQRADHHAQRRQPVHRRLRDRRARRQDRRGLGERDRHADEPVRADLHDGGRAAAVDHGDGELVADAERRHGRDRLRSERRRPTSARSRRASRV